MTRLLALALALWTGAAAAECRQALVLALDVSGSVDGREYALQLDGAAGALEAPEVTAALLAVPGAWVHLAVFEWSAGEYQQVILDWRALDSRAAIAAASGRLRGWPRRKAPRATALGAAMRFAEGVLARAPDCRRHTLDISGDGKNNGWPDPEDLRAAGALAGVTVNALVIGRDDTHGPDPRAPGIGELSAYFRERVIQGQGAFVETALGYEDYARAMRRKLLRELEVRAVGALPEGRR